MEKECVNFGKKLYNFIFIILQFRQSVALNICLVFTSYYNTSMLDINI